MEWMFKKVEVKNVKKERKRALDKDLSGVISLLG